MSRTLVSKSMGGQVLKRKLKDVKINKLENYLKNLKILIYGKL